MSLRRVRRIAYAVRTAFEEIASKEVAGPTDLRGYCNRASAQLYLECRRVGIPIEMWINDCHTFNVYGKWIVDITATQFGVKRKVVVRSTEKKSYYHAMDERAKSAFSCVVCWPLCDYNHRKEFDRDRRIVRKHVRRLGK